MLVAKRTQPRREEVAAEAFRRSDAHRAGDVHLGVVQVGDAANREALHRLGRLHQLRALFGQGYAGRAPLQQLDLEGVLKC